MIYNYKVSEVQDMEGIQAMIGICPQLNLHFEALTVKENLRIFAHVKGIRWKEVEQEVGMCCLVTDLCFTASWTVCWATFIKDSHQYPVLQKLEQL